MAEQQTPINLITLCQNSSTTRRPYSRQHAQLADRRASSRLAHGGILSFPLHKTKARRLQTIDCKFEATEQMHNKTKFQEVRNIPGPARPSSKPLYGKARSTPSMSSYPGAQESSKISEVPFNKRHFMLQDAVFWTCNGPIHFHAADRRVTTLDDNTRHESNVLSRRLSASSSGQGNTGESLRHSVKESHQVRLDHKCQQVTNEPNSTDHLPGNGSRHMQHVSETSHSPHPKTKSDNTTIRQSANFGTTDSDNTGNSGVPRGLSTSRQASSKNLPVRIKESSKAQPVNQNNNVSRASRCNTMVGKQRKSGTRRPNAISPTTDYAHIGRINHRLGCSLPGSTHKRVVGSIRSKSTHKRLRNGNGNSSDGSFPADPVKQACQINDRQHYSTSTRQNQGGTVSKELTRRTEILLLLALQSKITFTAHHIASDLNAIADRLSRPD